MSRCKSGCRYSKAFTQTYPRLCVDCGTPEPEMGKLETVDTYKTQATVAVDKDKTLLEDALKKIKTLELTVKDLKLRNHMLRNRTDLPLERIRDYDRVIVSLDRLKRIEDALDPVWLDHVLSATKGTSETS